MSKVITSPIERWKGSVTIADPLTIPQVQAIEAGMTIPEVGNDGRYWLSVTDAMQLPAILACVEKWELENFPEKVTAENFPASPRGDSHKLVEWLFESIRKIYFGEIAVPNESRPMPSSTQAEAEKEKAITPQS